MKNQVSIELLHERMATEMQGRAERNVFLRGDGDITYQELMNVIDKLKEGWRRRGWTCGRRPA